MRRTDIRKDLIEKELEKDVNDGFVFKSLKRISNSFVDNLFNKWYCHELCEFFYDREPNYDELEFDKYMTYCSILEKRYHNYCDEEYPIEELKQAYLNILQQRRDFEPRRVELNSWIEPYYKGNWGMTQQRVDDIARDILKKDIKKANVPLKDRLFYAEKDGDIRIYFYGRDIMMCDYWFIFLKRKG